MSDEGKKPVQNRPAVSVDVLRKVAKDSASAILNTKPVYVAPKPRTSIEAMLEVKNRSASAMLASMNGPSVDQLARKPWDRIADIKAMASRLMQHPPSHPERKRAEIARKIEEIHQLAEELLQEMPKTKSRQGAVGLD